MGKKKKRTRKIIVFTIEILLLLVLLAGLYVWSKYQKMDHVQNIEAEDVVNNDLGETTQEVLKGYTNIAVFGLDNEQTGNFESGNSDLIMIASINNDTKEVRVVSVYRDSYLNVNTSDDPYYWKANYAYNHGGPEQAVRMLNQNLDLDIEDYIAVDFYSVCKVIDLLGGLEINVEEGAMMDEINIYIHETAAFTGREEHPIEKPGLQLLDGVQATAYCRIRHDVNDFRRAQRQREVLSKIIDKTKSSSLSTINKIIDAVFEDISTDLSVVQLVSMASQLFNYKLTETTGFPFELYVFDETRSYIVVPCDLEKNVRELHAYLFNDHDYEPSNTVLNYSSAIVQDTGKTIGDEEDTGVEADGYAGQSMEQSGDTDPNTQAQDSTAGTN
ncbi:MAG: LCP family protein [Eubacterium sp.]|nr:LCP family protein [Eubacterium sp.]